MTQESNAAKGNSRLHWLGLEAWGRTSGKFHGSRVSMSRSSMSEASSSSTSSPQPPASSPPLLIGLTGGIASGKSAVAERFATLGVPVLDTDQIARDVVEPGTATLAKLVAEFGGDILDASGRLDRTRMREQVFRIQCNASDSSRSLTRLFVRSWRDARTPPAAIPDPRDSPSGRNRSRGCL